MKYLIVGLGNIGKEYENTRHNVGFMVLDHFAKNNDISFSIDRHAFIAEKRIKGRHLILIKPTTLMNLSGKAVSYWLRKESIDIQNMLIISDDLALDTGLLRMKKSGSAGGHNGLTDIIEGIGTDNFCRLRIGIGKNFSLGHQVDYVLNPFSQDEINIFSEKWDICSEIIKSFALQGPDKTMNLYNNK